MKSTGTLVNVTRDIFSNKLNVTLQIDGGSIEELQELGKIDEKTKKPMLLDVSVGKHKKKRSLNANRYAWELMSKIAAHPSIKSTKEEIYEKMLREYLCYDNDDGYIFITLRADIDVSKVGGHWIPSQRSEDGKFIAYAKLKGSSEYSTSEMAGFINLIVEECKKLGIETLTPRELDEMVRAWRTKDLAS